LTKSCGSGIPRRHRAGQYLSKEAHTIQTSLFFVKRKSSPELTP